jgi:pSer/pThr/pTyr-binding forkhead associated (FHA) protein
VLQITHERANIKQVKLGPKTTIGRGSECNLKIASGEISRRHCQLTVDDNKVFVCDLGSSNGTYLNGKSIPANQDIELTPGSRLTIGPLKCVVQFKSPSAAVVPPAEPAVLAGATAVATPELMGSTNKSDAAFTFTEPAGLDQADEVALPGKTGHDTVMDADVRADARNAAQQAIARASESPSDQTANAGSDVTSPAEVPTEFLFSPDDTTPPGALVAPIDDTPSFDAWNEAAANELAIPMEPMTIPVNKKKKSFFDFFTRKPKEPPAAAEPAPLPSTPSTNETEPVAPGIVTDDVSAPAARPEISSPGEAVPVATVPAPAPEPEPVVVPAAPVSAAPVAASTGDAEEIEPFWS